MGLKNQLDIFLITYNRDEALDKTLEMISADNSPIKDFTIRIIDNNSADNTLEVIKKHQTRNKNLHCLRNKYNIGGNANIMKAFYLAEKEYVWILADNDYYCWESWYEVEKAAAAKYDAIMVSNYGCPQISIAQLCNQATFLPGVIYKTSNIDDTVMGNMAFNISNMFPHFALFSKLINENKKIYIVETGIVEIGNNNDKKTGKHIYTRGYNDSVHPLMRDMLWLSGYANSLHLIKDKKLRSEIISSDIFIIPFTSCRMFKLNKKLGRNNFYNILSIFCVLNISDKIKFIINYIVYKLIYNIIYVYSECKRPEKGAEYIECDLHLSFLTKNRIIYHNSKYKKLSKTA